MLRWTAHPAKRRPQDAMLAAMVIALAAWAVLVSLGSPLLAALAIVLLVIAIVPFFAPTHYVLDGDQLRERRLFVTRTRRWDELKRLEVGKGAALVSPYREPRWLDRYRGIVVLLPIRGDGAEREAVIAQLRARVVG
ncbi:MAG: hypothetical protein H0T79_06900 [Deltaproteobacteria bacterium]|nr:hypothetical protein [Deltaproteobacteria bacterium]